ncbi:conserved protein of unknown function [Pseudodesulfovibrio profundus]|uniref:Uncharacterized protein n=1 Tax=Pseudodesulfovibrio profundus TaxID=57320 RepID=A0A2C8F7U2_9BACT|nr:hypothetical protein [Pseudodesulfovibrio profundus]SOB58820.1 conserved protein of unknown function [Pseudodesulfovibrio profundus]|tara:strand:+ start:5358 stop:5522 length:165 start_codon:yes stop_codon:yes gene_type:complete
MSMECDTRLSMMALRDNNRPQIAPRKTRRRPFRAISAASAAMASFTLLLFTRGV